MDITLLAVGRLRPAFREAGDDYLRRLGRWAKVREVEVREAGRAGSDVLQRREEARRLQAACPANGVVVALSRGGDAWSSRDLARRLGRWRDAGRHLVFVVGGAAGLDESLLRGASHRWSLGAMTLPHELARIIVVEQLYRAGTILRGEPYHKGA